MQEQQTLRESASREFVEALYSDFNRDPESVSSEWREYFRSVVNGSGNGHATAMGPSFRAPSIFHRPGAGPRGGHAGDDIRLQDAVNRLIHNYRVRGHRVARIDPLNRPRSSPPELDPLNCGIRQSEMEHMISGEGLGTGPTTVRAVLESLRETYCGPIGVEFMHIADGALRAWLQERMENTRNHLELTSARERRILKFLTAGVTFEEFVRRKFIGAKSFSLEGSEGLIPLLDMALEKAGEQGAETIIMGMAHRGRLNVLANIMGKSPRLIFREFEVPGEGRRGTYSDVKYHLGYSGDWKTEGGKKIHLSLCFNPSHLEFVNPIVLGRVRARQDRMRDNERTKCLAWLIHGDAALAGEGIIQETLNLMSLPGYTVGGTLHIVVNNQIGFTTSPEEGRSTDYATDVARMLQAPIFHVNSEDPAAMAQVVSLAMDFRKQFKRDVFIDLYGYRRLGHNETDEPSFTQPVLYKMIAQRKSAREVYLGKLLERGVLPAEEAAAMAQEAQDHLEKELAEATSGADLPEESRAAGIWKTYSGGRESEAEEVETGVEKARLAEILERQMQLPSDFHPHPKIIKAMELRHAMARGERMLDWSAAESLAFGSLAEEGFRVRLSGQDSGRGTFSQRHDILYDYEDGHSYLPLAHLAKDQAPVEIYNSPLSEAGVLGFDYGYSLDCPDGLILWEAQFGDFVNSAQVLVDQFLASAEEKWRRLSGLVLLLPHGLEGMGPEHSSARLERFLSLSAGDNMQVVNPTTPAQYFHCLRRQVLRRWRKPLVIMTPKGMLRNPLVASRLEDCASGRFQRVLADVGAVKKPARILLCSGKIYYELDAIRQKTGKTDTTIVRLEQLYPFPEEPLRAILRTCPDGTPATWVQEEPLNMGAWHFVRDKLGDKALGRFPLSVVAREESASPASGSSSLHKQEQQALIERAFGAGASQL